MSEDRSILLTGGAGFIGSHLAERLLSRGVRVVSLDNFDPSYPRAYKEKNVAPSLGRAGYRFVEGDIRDADLLRELFAEGAFDAVVHLAAKAGVRASLRDPFSYFDVNLGGTLTLLETCRRAGVEKFLFASSSSVYGANEKVPFSEEDRVDHPVSTYAMTKKAGEEICFTYHHLYGFDVVALRFFTVYGPRGRPEMAIHKFAHLITSGQPIPVFGMGDMNRDFTYIDDIVRGCEGALDLLLERDDVYEIFNLAASHTVPLERMIECLESELGTHARRELLPMQPGDVRRTYADVSRARRLLGYDPQVRIEDGIRRFVEWYRAEIMTLPDDVRAAVYR